MLVMKSDQNSSQLIELSKKLNLPFEEDVTEKNLTTLGFHDEKLALFPVDSGPVYVDFVDGKLAHRRQYGGGKKQPLARAIGLTSKNIPNVIDATAGMGRDSFVLASLGCQVKMIERSPVIAELLEDALVRARLDSDVSAIAERLSVICADACDYLPEAQPEDVIYLDPMYPEKRKSAAVKKDMRLLQVLVGPDLDSHKLLKVALQKAKYRVVVKRPGNSDPLEGQLPNASIKSPNTRYDIYSIKAF